MNAGEAEPLHSCRVAASSAHCAKVFLLMSGWVLLLRSWLSRADESGDPYVDPSPPVFDAAAQHALELESGALRH